MSVFISLDRYNINYDTGSTEQIDYSSCRYRKKRRTYIYTALFNSSHTFLKEKYQTTKTIVNSKKVEITFDNLPDGEYAFAIFHDANNNGVLDKGALGIPSEKYAFSNNSLPIMGYPTFETCKITIEDNTVSKIILQKAELNFRF